MWLSIDDASPALTIKNAKESLEAELSFKWKNSTVSTKFSNLYFIYNSLPVQGRLMKPPEDEKRGLGNSQ